MTLIVLFIALLVPQAMSASAVTVSAPVKVADIDAGKLKGEPTQLAWSPDASQFFLQTSERDPLGMAIKPRSFVVPAAGGKPDSVQAPPAWVSEYWTWKAGKAAPGAPAFLIDVKDEQKAAAATSAPMGGNLARGGTSDAGTTVDDMSMHAQQMQKQHIISLTLKGQTVGEFVNQQFLPGYTFSWSPQELGLIAYASLDGKLTLMDAQGNRQEVAPTRNVILPAWSSDGGKIAYLQKVAKNKYELYVVEVKKP